PGTCVPGASGPWQWEETINVTAGQTYSLLVDNYTTSNSGFSLVWGGTAVIGPDANFTITQTGCYSYNFTKNFAIDPSTNSTYFWSFGDGGTSTSQNPSYTYSSGGTYIISLQVTDLLGCSSTTSQTVVIGIWVPTITPDGPTTFCDGGSVTLTSSAASSYLWNTSATTQAITVNTSGTYSVTATDALGCTGTNSQAVTADAAINLSTIKTDVACFGNSTGAVDLTVSGGTSPFTYLWTGGSTTEDISGVASGTYSVTVTDALSCTSTTSVTLTQPASALTASITGTNVDCFGASTGSATVTASGGTTPYTYDWSPNGFTGDGTITYSALTDGIYTVTVTDANLCTTSVSATITEPAAALSVALDVITNVACFGESTGGVSVSISGGTAPYTFDWSNDGPEAPDNDAEDLAGVAAGSYTL
ncbi:MAG: PKD domain-containing protein, partial [Bacteroidia bacterium]|nr:PKD domain-containing protein [Bacteroidia bacterium]